MQAQVRYNAKALDGAVSIEIAGNVATVEAEVGSELDGMLYYNWTRRGNPKFTLSQGHAGSEVTRRFDIEHVGGHRYTLTSQWELES